MIDKSKKGLATLIFIGGTLFSFLLLWIGGEDFNTRGVDTAINIVYCFLFGGLFFAFTVKFRLYEEDENER